MAVSPLLTTITPGGLTYTVALFRSSGLDEIVTLSLHHSANFSSFHRTPQSRVDSFGQPIPLTGTEIASYRGIAWTKVALPLIGDFGQALVDLSRLHIQELAREGRSTQLTVDSLYRWLIQMWPPVRTHFLASRSRNLANKEYALRKNVLWAPDSYELSFVCPDSPPYSLIVDIPEIIVPDSPAAIPAIQVFLPYSVPFSSVVVADPVTAYDTQAFAEIAYPSQGAQFNVGVPVTLLANTGHQTESTHRFTWYFANRPALNGIQIQTPFLLPDPGDKVPITLLVTNLKTGMSASVTTFISVVGA